MASIQTVGILDEMVDFLSSSPSPQQILEFKVSDSVQARIAELLEQNREGSLSTEEHAEMEEISRLNHFMIMLKARTREKLEAETNG